jgi:murein DD-endopeptidase MepM/ murein hydrolase activator NlpD
MALKSAVAIIGLTAGAIALSGCTTMGSAMHDPTITGSVAGANGSGNLNQPMPGNLGVGTQVAANQFIPPANVGGGAAPFYSGPAMSGGLSPMTGARPGSVTSSDLPSLSSSTSSYGTPQAMPVQSSVAPVAATPATSLGSLPSAPPAQAAAPNLTVVPQDAYLHVVESGESLYTIARRYDVTAQAIMKANGSLAPDKIYVGQKLIIPGRPDLVANRSPAPSLPAQSLAAPSQPLPQVAQKLPVDSAVPTVAGVQPAAASLRPHMTSPAPQKPQQVAALQPSRTTPAAPNPQQAAAAQTLQTAAVQPEKPAPVLQEPAMSGADKFRWPVKGKVITDFAGTKGTGINIDAPEGTAVRAAENGTVIYVGSGVEGYGNLVLIRHANGYVSAYAHLKSMSVAKGDVVSRGDTIGAAGMTGSVSRPQLHFELRQGATPVDPVPMLAG